MAGEAEFSFVVAKFGYNEGLFDEKTYASIAFAILLSTIISPALLRTTLAISHLEDKECSQQQQQHPDTHKIDIHNERSNDNEIEEKFDHDCNNHEPNFVSSSLLFDSSEDTKQIGITEKNN
jgi:hypothetical protein